MRCWAVQFVLCLLIFSSHGLELEIVANGETKPTPSVVQTKAATTFSLVCKSESCRSNCESLTWRRRRKGTGSSLESSPVSGSNWLNFTDTTLDDQGFYDCVDTEHNTGKVAYVVVRKPGFEKESIEMIKKDLVLIRKKRDADLVNRTNIYDPYFTDYFLSEDWRKNMSEVLHRETKEYFDSLDNKYYNTNDQHSKRPKLTPLKIGIFYGSAAYILISIAYYIVKCCIKISTDCTNRENVSKPPSTSNTTTVNKTIPPSSPLLEVLTAPPTTDLNEVEQNGKRQDTVDTDVLPPTYEEALNDIALGSSDPPSEVCHSGSGGEGSSHDTGGGTTTCDYGGGR